MSSVASGSRLGPYEVISRVGAGAMGEVFQARDTRLDRTVAIKILPREFADDAQLKMRFEREAKAISQISHPNICTLHDVGHADGVDYLVLEFLEGETLADRIERGALPVADVLRFGKQIASALDRAHRAGIIHRDLKPGNIMLTKSGAKLLDFGLARSTSPPVTPTDLTQHKPLTGQGMILGTYQYMSPEQLGGEDADARSDIFSLGAVLYEMLTGARAFDGKSRTSIIAAVVAGQPRPPSSLQPMTPPALEHVISKCLAKEREDRWQSASDIASELEWIGGSTTGGTAVAVPGRHRRSAIPIIFAIIAAQVVALIATAVYFARRLKVAEEPLRTELLPDEPLTSTLFGAIALSPDGSQLAILVGPAAKRSIAVRNLATGETKRLAGTEGAMFPFWSPDGQRIAFFADGKLKTIGSSGAVQIVCDAKQGRGGTWGRDGTIVFTPDLNAVLYKVSENGGTPVAVTRAKARNPMFLPDGKTFLFLGLGNVCAGSIDGGPEKTLVENASNTAFARGRLFFVRDGNLLSQPFDPAKLELSGSLTSVADHIEFYKVRDIANYSVTAGRLVYVSEAPDMREIVAYDRSGRASEINAPPAGYKLIDVSPDGRTLAVAINEHIEQGDIWLVNVDGGSKSRLTFGGGGALSGAFSPDGSRFAWSSGHFGQGVTLTAQSLVSNDTRKLGEFRAACIVTDWSRDGKYIVYDGQRDHTGFDVEAIDATTGAVTSVVHGTADEVAPALSPNGKWLAYVSAESGSPEVYLTTFPTGQGKWQATQDGGTSPRWSRDGKQLLCIRNDRLTTIDFHDGSVPQFGTQSQLPVKVPSDPLFITSSPGYVLTPDGRIITTRPFGNNQPTIHLITNWASN